jgi:membrane fusion protein, copper/silver efflux system
MHRPILSFALSAFVALAVSAGAFAQGHDHSAMSMPASGAGAKTAALTTPAAFKGQLDGVYTAYLALQAALSGDAFATVGPNAQALTLALQKADMKLLADQPTHLAWMTAAAALAKSAVQVANAKDIEAARAAFKPLSATLITTAKQFGTSGKRPLYVLHCPMAFNNAGADWVQGDKATRNPYFGKTMLSCGKITETIGAGSGM